MGVGVAVSRSAVRRAVDLHDEELLWPAEVDLEAQVDGVDDRLRQAESQERVFGGAARAGAAGRVELERPAERLHAVAAGWVRDVDRDEAPEGAFVQDVRELERRERVGEVDYEAGEASDGD